MARMQLFSLAAVALFLHSLARCRALLYPRESESREVKELNGLWNFRADYSPGRDAGFTKQWYREPLSKSGDTILMPVPSSFNDITQNVRLRYYVGWVWYDRVFWVPKAWKDDHTRIMLRFESAHYKAIAWVNGMQVTNHSGGHLPFESDITNRTSAGKNLVTIAINNTLAPHTLPPGTLSFPKGNMVQNLQFDFFNYAGLHRPVRLYTTPISVYVDDITVVTTLADRSATLDYIVKAHQSNSSEIEVVVKLYERIGRVIARKTHSLSPCMSLNNCIKTTQGKIVVDSPHLWWPWTMNEEAGYLYDLQVTATTKDGVEDVYQLPVGIRTVAIKGMQFLINNKPFYFLGVGKHEDADIRGKGLDYPLIMKDVNLIKWLGANSIRTSHYPYAEEFMDLCDKNGIVVIDECPAVGLKHLENFKPPTLAHHLEVMTELVQRDKNRPSVVMWSVANEPASQLPVAKGYFEVVIDYTRKLDPTRPITLAFNTDSNDRVGQLVDVIAVNRYYGWYQSPAHPEVIPTAMSEWLDKWYKTHHKPMIVAEYGAGAIAGFHKDPPTMFSEEYQAQVLMNEFKAFDKCRGNFLVGEMIWNFADFETDQGHTRVDGNKKGILTRQRQPKMAARLLRQRYTTLAQGLEPCYDRGMWGFSDNDGYHCIKSAHT